MPYDGPISLETLRDLLALARALYATFVELGPAYDEQRHKLRGIGYQLTLAIERAQGGGPGSFKHRAAWLIAEEAVRNLGEVVGAEVQAKALVAATGRRLMKRRGE